MKTVRRTDTASQSCSCTSCVYKSESEQLSLRKYIAHGSRISRLYFGKYIPLRERKLLNRLVRTRAVYDDLRARLISDSTLSLEKNADLRHGKHHRVVKPLDSDQSGAILELVDLIDKGAAFDPKKLKECCSCCSCSSIVNILEGGKKRQKHKRGDARIYEEEYEQRTKHGKGEGVFTKTYEREHGRTVPGRIGERYNKRGVHFKAKYIRSDPCTCTFKFSGLIKKHSKAMIRKIRNVSLEELFPDIQEPVNVKLKNKKNVNISFQKYKNLQNKIEKDIKKINESTAKIKQSVRLHAKRSLEQFKHVKNNVKTDFESGVKKSLQAVKDLKHKEKAFESYEYPEMETDFKIKKDSIVKFKDYLKRKELLKDWECDLECQPDTCVPDECFKIIKLRRSQKRNRPQGHNYGTRYEIIHREAKVGGIPLSKSSSGMQAEYFAITKGTPVKKQKPILRVEGKNQLLGKRLKLKNEEIKKSRSKEEDKNITGRTSKSSVLVGILNENVVRRTKEKVIKLKASKTKFHPVKKEKQPKIMYKVGGKIAEKSSQYLLPDTHRENDLRSIKEKRVLQRKDNIANEKNKKATSRGRQAVRITSSLSFNLEFYKDASNSKTPVSSEPPGIHVHKKRKKVRRHHKGSQIILISSTDSSRSMPEKHKARLIQTDKYNKSSIIVEQKSPVSNIIQSECECEKRFSNVRTNTDYITNSVSSLTNRSILATTNKNVSNEVKQKERLSQTSLLPVHGNIMNTRVIENNSSHKQAVRIGSTFSFNIEFYKKGNENKLQKPITAKVKKNPISFITKSRYVSQQLIKGTPAKTYIQAKTTLHRCFCTLKGKRTRENLHRKAKPKKKIKTSTTATATVTSMPSMIDKYVDTRKNIRYKMPKVYKLQPYECEPGICIPDECNPVLCKQIIDLRKGNRKSSKTVGSYASSRKTKSTSSIVSRPFTPAVAKTVQSSIVSTKVAKTSAPRRYKKHLNLGRNELHKTKLTPSDRQVVRIGSSFAFNIEFFKDKQTSAAAIANKPSLSTMKKVIKYEQNKIKNSRYRQDKPYNKSMFTQVINLNKNVGPSFKRCFCTLKLYKNKMSKYKAIPKAEQVTANTQTFGGDIIVDAVNKSTEIKRKHLYKLLPFECEPYVCTPGECDPYLCIKKIEKRQLNTRDYGVFTEKPEMMSVSSITDNSFRKSERILVHPKLNRRGTNMKSTYIKPRPENEYIAGSGKKVKARNDTKQAVRIGSSFRFNIEFSKHLTGTGKLPKYLEKKGLPQTLPKVDREKDITVTKVRVNHRDTQVLDSRKVHKASLVRPMLKRCFCTLNLQKKTKPQYNKGSPKYTSGNKHFGPNIYTVGRATTTRTKIISHSYESQSDSSIHLRIPRNKKISISTSSMLLNKYVNSFSKYYPLNLNHDIKYVSMIEVPTRSHRPFTLKSNFSMTLDITRQLGLCNVKPLLDLSSQVCLNNKPPECLKLLTQPSHQSLTKISGVTRYLEQCFCTMNVQIVNPKVPHTLKKISNKLKTYECEPGICIPGECDPYECKKLIMRRFDRNVHKSSGTNSTNKSTSSYASNSRNMQVQTHLQRYSQKSTSPKYKNDNQQRYYGSKQRKAVHVKSSFSFNLEFYKPRSQPFEKYVSQNEPVKYNKYPVTQKTYNRVNKGVQGNRVQGIDNHLQKNITSMDVVSTASATMKRCFCTLKLQKKGRIQREKEQLITKTKTHPKSTMSKSVKIGTTVKYQKISDDLGDLKSYECEPGICIPGQCNPYKCLELIKQRKNFGINTTHNEKVSVPSMANEGYSKGIYKTRAVDTIPKRIHRHTKTTKYSKNIDNSYSYISKRSSRPGVRIGSNFRFNIELFKGTPQLQKWKETQLRQVKAAESVTKQNSLRREHKSIVLQSTKKVSQRHTQRERANNEPTMTTSLMERCFCTAKLRPTEVPMQRNTTTFKNKCLCFLGLRKKNGKINQLETNQRSKANDVQTEKLVETFEKPTNTNNRQKVHLTKLEPYECEPGICIPGQCDPNMCFKIIQQRMAKQYSKGSETESTRTQSVSSTIGNNNKRKKNEKTQAPNRRHKNLMQYQLGTNTPSGYVTFKPDKRLVRIGSNFSFDIEFYKKNVNGSEIKEKMREFKSHPTKSFQNKKIEKPYILKSNDTETPKSSNARSDESQVKKNDKTFGVNPLLKRCFCTLKLMNKPMHHVDDVKKYNQVHTKPNQKSIKTQSKIIRNSFRDEVIFPYECEPYVCIPNECDPVECLKRIKRRYKQTKDFGVVTTYPKRKSIGSVATRMRDENLQATFPRVIFEKGVKNTTYTEESRSTKPPNKSRNAVRIGSNFSFNIEFSKGINNDAPNVIGKQPAPEINFPKFSKKNSQVYTNTQYPNLSQSREPQTISTNMPPPEHGVAHLKRCFCTLQLKNKSPSKFENKSMGVQSNQIKSNHSSMGQFLKKCACTFKLNKIGKLQNQLPVPAIQYGIKGTSTDNRRITQNHTKNPITILRPYECEPYICIPGECDPYECLKRIEQRRFRDFGTDYNRYVKDSATDSIRQPSTKSTKAQYQKPKMNSRGTSLVTKRTRHIKETAKYTSEASPNYNRQLVRIGSNFSFNVEFFKDQRTANTEFKDITEYKVKNNSKIKTRSEKLPTKPRGSVRTEKRQRSKSLHSTYSKRQGRSSALKIGPNRCFCTLKLLKTSNYPNTKGMPLPPNKIIKDKMTNTKVKYYIPHELGVYECPPLMCIPGECNPHECLDKMKRRGITRKSRNVGMESGRTTASSAGKRTLKFKAHKVQSQLVTNNNFGTFTPDTKPHSEILKSSKVIENIERRKKRAVRIGSNFNSNVQFFKHKSQPSVIRIPKILKATHIEDTYLKPNKNVTVKPSNYISQTEKITLKDQASEPGNLLKRCFCTLQLHKYSQQKNIRKNGRAPGVNVKYPQTFTVGRVLVEPLYKNIKTNSLRKTEKSRSTSINPKLFHRNVGTKTNTKYIRNNQIPLSQCTPKNCPDYHKIIFERNNNSDMQTILPYTPSKFNRKESRTYVAYSGKDKANDILIFNKDKRRLTAKKNKNSIPTNTLGRRSDGYNSSFFCRCVRFFTRQSKTRSKASVEHEDINNNEERKIYTNEQIKHSQPAQFKFIVTPKKTNQSLAKSVIGENCPNVCPKTIKASGKRYSIFQRGDGTSAVQFNDNQSKIPQNEKKHSKHPKMRVTFADSTKLSTNYITDEKQEKSMHSKSSMRSRLCHSCSVNDCPLKSNKAKTDQKRLANFRLLEKSNTKAASYSESADDCQYCECCKRKIDMNEISKGGGDRRPTKSSRNKDSDVCPCDNIAGNERKYSLRQEDKVSNKNSMKDGKCCIQTKPLFEMHIDSENYGIINKEEVQLKVGHLSNSNEQMRFKISRPTEIQHGKLCRCCKCVGKREIKGAKISVKAKGPDDLIGTFRKIFPVKKDVPNKTAKRVSPCTCGSKKCAIVSKKKLRDKPEKQKLKIGSRCVCGSSICTKESKRLQNIRDKATIKLKRKVRSVKDKKETKELHRRLKIEREKDEIRRLKRIKRNKELENKVKKYKNASDIMLAVDNLADIGKLGISTLTGALRYTAKAAIDPKVACEKCKICKKKDSESINEALKQLQKDYVESDAAATARRLKMRCLFMKRVQSLRQKLEENPVTHFILHMADKNMKTRQFKRKPVRRVREPLDFQCSLYMASLRKRPHLAVYYKCPSFYPHFLTMLNIWKQFTDIILFLLAAVVWSPCILCMEGCRALLCCFFCTG